jgi:hypothetical protein
VTAVVDRSARAQTLLRRQLVLTAALLGVAVLGVALLRSSLLAPGQTHYIPISTGTGVHVRAIHDAPSNTALRLAVAELVLCGALALVALGHAADVIAFVLDKEHAR